MQWGALSAALLMFVMTVGATTVPGSGGSPVEGTTDVNLAWGQPYTVTTRFPLAEFQAKEAQYADDGFKLTDGKVGPEAWQSAPAWVGFHYQDRRDIVVDLGRVQALHKLVLWALQDKASAIWLPRDVTFAVSQDGRAWKTVGTAQAAFATSDTAVRRQAMTVSQLNVAARFVRYSFHPAVWVFVSELEAWGYPGGAGTLKPDSVQFPQAETPRAAGSPAVQRRHNKVLMYSGYYPETEVSPWSESMIMPYLTYMDRSGKPVDTMFDSFLWLQFESSPSGGKYLEGKTTRDDWTYWLDSLFRPGNNLSALNTAVAKAKLSLPDKFGNKVPVVISLPYPGVISNWASGIDFDHRNAGRTAALENRLDAVQWFISETQQRWIMAGYTNLTLAGFYWSAEYVHTDSPDDEALIKGVAELVHDAGPYTFEWIPYMQAQGYQLWKQLGFDTAHMQPGYAFTGNAERLPSTVAVTHFHGMGIEMEIHWDVLKDTPEGHQYRQNFYAHMDSAVNNGYDTEYTIWFQSFHILGQARKSSVPDIEAVYHDAYRFIKGTYAPRNPVNGD